MFPKFPAPLAEGVLLLNILFIAVSLLESNLSFSHVFVVCAMNMIRTELKGKSKERRS